MKSYCCSTQQQYDHHRVREAAATTAAACLSGISYEYQYDICRLPDTGS